MKGGIDKAKLLTRVRQRMDALGLSEAAASEKSGKPDSIRNLRRAVEDGARQGVTMTTVMAWAPALNTTLAWLVDGSGVEDTEREAERTIPVWGKAGAGGEINNYHEATEIGRIPEPDGATEHTSAIEVSGESLGRIFDRWYAIYDEVRDPPTADLHNQLCVVQLADGRVFIKRLKRARGKRWHLEANFEAPIENVEVVWAARVKTLTPR